MKYIPEYTVDIILLVSTAIESLRSVRFKQTASEVIHKRLFWV